jgi:beta-lactamase regulating signal transducer with metallopeptidase domain/outer membrane protein assembly factor BamB
MSDYIDDMLSLAGNDLCLRWMITLLHFFWQGAAIGLAVAVLSRILREASASVRYRLHSLALLGLPACVAVTFAMVYVPSTARQQVPEIARVELHSTSGPELDSVHITNQTAASESTSASASLAETPIDKRVVDDRVPEHRQHRIESQSLSWADLAWLAPWISAIYVCGVVLFLMRLGMGLWGGHRLRSITKPLSDSAVTQYIREQANRLGLRIIPLVGYCENVAVPTVIGVLRPMILLPASVVTGLSPQELAAVLSHELAHIRRYDLWMNLMQRMIESLLFFHPVVWFISRRVSVEREICCDDLVVRVGHTPMNYAGALLRMAELCVTVNKSHLAALAAAGHSPAELELRIERLMNVRHRASLRLTRAGVVLVIGSLLACVAAPAMLAAMGQPNTREMPEFDDLTQTVPTDFDLESGKNVRWRVPLGSVTMRAPLVHADQIYVGTNNHHAYNSRYPTDVDLGVLLCFRKSDGKFLWQHSNEKLPTGRAHDWPLQGVTSRPSVEGDRLWYITNRCEIVCLDTQGFHDLQNDGVIKDEVPAEANEADVVWRYDMMAELGVRPHNISTCTVAIWKDRIFAVTGNGVGESHQAGVADAPSFIALDKQSGQLLWSDNSPGQNVLHGQWGSPVVAELAGRTQVIFPGGDGWLYSFDPLGGPDGRSSLIWKFDCNPKDSTWVLGGRGTRNNLLHAPTVHQGLLYIAMGQDPEHGSGPGRVWCIDPSGTGDVSPELVFNKSDPETLVPHRRAQACIAENGDFTRPNPNSKAVWQFTGQDVDGNGELTIEESMSRSLSSISIKDDLLFVSDVDGILHCLDRRTGRSSGGLISLQMSTRLL